MPPKDKTFDLALELHRAGRHDEAMRTCRKLLRRKPTHHRALGLFAHAALETGQLAQAREAAERLATLRPDDVAGWNLRGRVALLEGDAETAHAAQTRAIEISEEHPWAWFQLGLARKMLGEAGPALEAFARAHSLAPDETAMGYNHALALLENGEAQACEALCREALARAPGHPGFLHALGLSLLVGDRHHEAVSILREAVDRRPRDTALRADYGSALASIGDQVRGIEQLRESLRLAPDAVVTRESLVKALRGIGRIDEALAELDRLEALPGYRGNAVLQRASLLGSLGRHDESIALVEPFLDDPGTRIEATAVFAEAAGRTGRAGEAIRRIEAIAAETDYDRADATTQEGLLKLDFLLGDLHDARGESDAAFAAYRRGNARRRAPYDHADRASRIDRIMTLYGAEQFAELPRSGNTSQTPIFIVGMPRSGTSLLEQMLDCLPEVHGAGELSSIDNLSQSLSLELGTPFPDLAREVSRARLAAVAEEHLGYLAALSEDAPRVTDKMPGNYLHLGLIAQLFPAARVIHCRREPRDTALSIYFQNFANHRGHPYANDLADIGFEYRQYERLMRHWKQALPLPIHDVQYERLTADPEAVTRDLCRFLDLEWSAAMLRFHESRRVVVTASSQQVRQRLYTTSVARWERYRDHLEPLENELARFPDL